MFRTDSVGGYDLINPILAVRRRVGPRLPLMTLELRCFMTACCVGNGVRCVCKFCIRLHVEEVHAAQQWLSASMLAYHQLWTSYDIHMQEVAGSMRMVLACTYCLVP